MPSKPCAGHSPTRCLRLLQPSVALACTEASSTRNLTRPAAALREMLSRTEWTLHTDGFYRGPGHHSLNVCKSSMKDIAKCASPVTLQAPVHEQLQRASGSVRPSLCRPPSTGDMPRTRATPRRRTFSDSCYQVAVSPRFKCCRSRTIPPRPCGSSLMGLAHAANFLTPDFPPGPLSKMWVLAS